MTCVIGLLIENIESERNSDISSSGDPQRSPEVRILKKKRLSWLSELVVKKLAQ